MKEQAGRYSLLPQNAQAGNNALQRETKRLEQQIFYTLNRDEKSLQMLLMIIFLVCM